MDHCQASDQSGTSWYLVITASSYKVAVQVTLAVGEGIVFGPVCLSVYMFVCLHNFRVFLRKCLSD